MEVMLHVTKLHMKELRNLYSVPNIVRVLILSRTRQAGHVTNTGCM
jgi:hypothetical protein